MSKMSTNQGERIMAVEVRVEQLERKVDQINNKLDDLLALRYKGQGAFWLASALFGTGIIGLLSLVINYLRGN